MDSEEDEGWSPEWGQDPVSQKGGAPPRNPGTRLHLSVGLAGRSRLFIYL